MYEHHPILYLYTHTAILFILRNAHQHYCRAMAMDYSIRVGISVYYYHICDGGFT